LTSQSYDYLEVPTKIAQPESERMSGMLGVSAVRLRSQALLQSGISKRALEEDARRRVHLEFCAPRNLALEP
jgi:hypothetical protein